MSRHGKLELLKVAKCGASTCPTIYRTTRDTLVVQGTVVDPESVDVELGPGELLVEIPESLLAGLLTDRQRPAP
ncbi:MAG TPA: hypothetical protein VFW27_38565 [Actinoplanes sp.]|jgi:hypothetical protein|nr:hypothetical protein [Actinoplanes sp.]